MLGNPITGVVEVLGLSLGTKTLPPVPEILREKEKSVPRDRTRVHFKRRTEKSRNTSSKGTPFSEASYKETISELVIKNKNDSLHRYLRDQLQEEREWPFHI